jgi:hypothetical protein
MGYQVANDSYQPAYTNRVILITDAQADSGVTDERLISMVARNYDARHIRLSGVGVGRTFNDSLLDQLTERGKGAYVFLGSENEVDAVFGPRFVSLIETIASDVHFKLHLPPSLKMDTFYGEEASTSKERVQSIHYFANTSQMFLSDLRGRNAEFPGTDDVMFTIEYEDPETGESRVEEFAWQLASVQGRDINLNKANLVSTFARRLDQLAQRPLPSEFSPQAHGWLDDEAAQTCADTRQELQRLSSRLGSDPEANRLVGLWDTYCSRYRPVELADQRHDTSPRRSDSASDARNVDRPTNDFAPRDSWPSASR